MSLNLNKIRQVVTKTFEKVGDLRTAVAYVNVTGGSYDPATGVNTETSNTYNFLAPIVRADEKEQASFPGINDVQVILADYKSIPSFTPRPSDYVTIGGVRWEVLRLRPSVGHAVTRIYVGRP